MPAVTGDLCIISNHLKLVFLNVTLSDSDFSLRNIQRWHHGCAVCNSVYVEQKCFQQFVESVSPRIAAKGVQPLRALIN